MLTIIIFLAFALLFYSALSWLASRRLRMQQRLEEAVKWGRMEQKEKEKKSKDPLVRRLALVLGTKWVGAKANKGLDKVQTKLASAGSPLGLSAKEWIGLRMLCALFGLGVGTLLVVSSGARPMALLFWVALTLAGWVGPDFWLSKRATQRQTDILRQLPNALDLLTVSVEAGLGFDQAIDRLAQKLTGPLADEFARALKEIQLGSARSQALQRLAARSGVDAVRTFVSSVVQSERLGVGMAQVLRVQAAEVRRKRRMDAQERAMKAPIKMLFPLVLFVFPALFVVVLGPAAIHIMAMFKAT